jgi:GAF domain-containing protein
MRAAPFHPFEQERVASLRRYAVMDTEPDDDIDDLIDLLRVTVNTPVAGVAFIDSERQWFKSMRGFDIREGSRSDSLGAYALLQPLPLVVPDTTKDERFVDNPSVSGPPYIRFYMAAPLLDPCGLPIGAVSCLDYVPRSPRWTEVQLVKVLARQVMCLVELRALRREVAARTEFVLPAAS